MTEPLDDLYLTWLYKQVADVREKRSSRTYWTLLKQLYTKEFVWLIPNDDNRLEDGRDLRLEFRTRHRTRNVTDEWMGLGCSMFEMILALSKRLSFEAEHTPQQWFWELLRNLELDSCTDAAYEHNEDIPTIVDGRLDDLIWRLYDPSGLGGLFPLHRASEDQRDVEIWYQLSAYLLEQD